MTRLDSELQYVELGADHAQRVWETCPDCYGEGVINKPRPFADDPYFCIVVTCETCGGAGGFVHEAEGGQGVEP